jgi:hypothetical protein
LPHSIFGAVAYSCAAASGPLNYAVTALSIKLVISFAVGICGAILFKLDSRALEDMRVRFVGPLDQPAWQFTVATAIKMAFCVFIAVLLFHSADVFAEPRIFDATLVGGFKQDAMIVLASLAISYFIVFAGFLAKRLLFMPAAQS